MNLPIMFTGPARFCWDSLTRSSPEMLQQLARKIVPTCQLAWNMNPYGLALVHGRQARTTSITGR
jgi:hypothetical protein